MSDHDFLPVAGHPDDDECTHRDDGTDATYCGLPAAQHEWLDRPESDSRECLICGEEASG